MENYVLFRYHNEMGHIGINKMLEAIRRTHIGSHEYVKNVGTYS